MPNPVKIEFLVENNTQAGLTGISRGFRGVDKSANSLLAKIKALETLVERLRQSKESGISKELEMYKKQVDELNRKLETLQSTTRKTKIVPKDAPEAKKKFDSLNMSIQQIARELPALAMGPQMFFLAISNNLPIFTEQLANAREEYQALTAAGQKATPVWKRLLSSIFSWQTAFAVAIMLMVTYGKEIGDWIKGLFGAKSALDTAAVAAERFHATMAKGRVEAQKEIVQLDALYRVASDAARPYDERRTAVRKLQEVYPAYFGNMSTEQIMVGEAIDKYNTLREAILATAEARAAADAITENQKQITLLKQTGDAYENYKRALDDVAEAEAKYDAADKEFHTNAAGVNVEITDELIALKGARNQAREARKEFEKELLKLSGGEELWAQIKEQFDKNINDFEENIRRQNERLLPLVDRVAAGQTVEDQNKTAEAARKAAEETARKKQGYLKEIATSTRNLEFDAQQAEIDAMAEGTKKKLAQIELDYRRRAQAIKANISEIQELYRKYSEAEKIGDASSDWYKARQEMLKQFQGNVNHLSRPLVDAAELIKQGWKDAGDGIATVFSSQYGILDASGKEVEILVTPILPNGDILSPKELEDYIYGTLENQENVLKADNKKIVIATNVSTDGSAGERYHQLQEIYYQDNIKVAESLLVKAKALNEANEAQRQSERQLAIGGKALGAEEFRIQLEEEAKAWEKYLLEYGTFRERLQATKESYDRRIIQAETSAERERLAIERDAVLAEFEVQASEWAEQLIELSVGGLEKLMLKAQMKLQEAQKAFDALPASNTKEAQVYRKTINELNAQIKLLERQLKTVKKEAGASNWPQFASAFQDMAQGLHESADACREFDEGLADVVDQTANAVSGIGSMIAAIDGIGKAATGLEKASAILMAISAAVQIASMIFSFLGGAESAVERTRREFAELNAELIRLKNEAALNNWEGTIFNSDPYHKAANNMKVYTDAMDRYVKTIMAIKKRGEEVSMEFARPGFTKTDKGNLYKFEKEWESIEESIANMQVQTRHSTWLRSAKYQSLGSLLPELFDKTGSLNMDALKEFQGSDLYDKLTADNKAFIDALIADWELYEEALAEVKDYLTGIFGDLGNTISDALLDAFTNGTNAAETFKQSVSSMLQKLAKDMIYSVALAPIFEKAQEEMLSVMGDTHLSDEERFNKYADILGAMTDEALGQQDKINDLLAAYEAAAIRNGLSLSDPETMTQTGKAGALQTVTQDSFSRVEGLITSIQIHAASIDEEVEGSSEQLSQALSQLRIIAENTSPIKAIYDLLVVIDREGVKIKG